MSAFDFLPDGSIIALGTGAIARLSPMDRWSRDASNIVPSAADFAATVSRIRAAGEVTHAPPQRLNADLRPYQIEGFSWLARLADWGIGGCLADDMGLGKTLQAIALLLHRASLGPALVAAPTSVGFNWMRELERFAPSLQVVDYRSERTTKLRAGQVVVVSYGLLAREERAFSGVLFATVVFDEAHALKNPDTSRTRAALAINAELKIALSGTPVENRLMELWSLFRIVAPGILGSAENFRTRFVLPIEQRRDTHARQLLSRLISPFILRRTKALVAPELPSKTIIEEPVDMSLAEQAHYDGIRRLKIAEMKASRNRLTGQKARIVMLAALTELRLAVCHPLLVDENSTLPGSKLEALLRLIVGLRENGHRALVFSQFTSFLSIIEQALRERAISYHRLDGATPASARAERIDAFERGEGDVSLLSLQAGGSGLNLTSADYVIIVDPWWNPAIEDQAIGRAHRIGQRKPVTVYRLFARGTIEEKIIAMHLDKRELVAAVMDNASDAPLRMSGDDLLHLLDESETA